MFAFQVYKCPCAVTPEPWNTPIRRYAGTVEYADTPLRRNRGIRRYAITPEPWNTPIRRYAGTVEYADTPLRRNFVLRQYADTLFLRRYTETSLVVVSIYVRVNI